MNRTDDEPRTEADVMATAFSTMRKYGMNILTATQHMDINAYVKSDPRMPRTRLRRYLGQYGLRGEALSAEVRRIVAGPERPDNTLKAGIFYTWPYGWEPADFTPMMRRIFRGKRTRHVMLFDELPQLFNILKGDMSLVGPRPERPFFVEKFREEIPRYMVKHQVRPGLTGWAQVNGYRGDTSIRKRIDCDLYYIENWSIGFDIKILFLTIFKGFINKNAY